MRWRNADGDANGDSYGNDSASDADGYSYGNDSASDADGYSYGNDSAFDGYADSDGDCAASNADKHAEAFSDATAGSDAASSSVVGRKLIRTVKTGTRE